MARKGAEQRQPGIVWLFIGSILKYVAVFVRTFGLWLPMIYAAFGGLLFLIFRFNPFKFDTWGTLYLCGAIACVLGAAVISVKNAVVIPVKGIIQGYKRPFEGIFRRRKPKVNERNIEAVIDSEKEEVVKTYNSEKRWNPPEIPVYSPEKHDYGYFEKAEIYPVTKSERRQAQNSLMPDWLPKISGSDSEKPIMQSEPKQEKPVVYFSGLDKTLMVHEYSDRYELYRVSGDNFIRQEGVEYK